MNIQKYEKKDRKQWEVFLDSSINGTFYHSMDFLEYYANKKEEKPHHLIFKQNEKIVCILPAGILNNNLISPFCATFGGFIHHKNLKPKEAIEIVKLFLDYCKKKEIWKVSITQPLQLYYQTPNNHIEFALLKNGFVLENYEISSFMEVKEEVDFKKEAKKAVRKAEREGVKVIESEDYENFYPILLKNKGKYDAKPTHTLEELKGLKRCLGKKLRLFLVYLKKELIGGSVIYCLNDNVIYAMYWCHKKEYESVRPINKLAFEINKWAFKSGFKYFDLGNSTIKSILSEGIVRFKESLGARGVLREKWEKKI